MEVNWQSVIKAGLVGVVLSIPINILSAATGFVPAIGILSIPAACCGFFLIPIGAGALYGYFTPGEETTQQAAIGGAISGFAAGFMGGIIGAITTTILSVIDGIDIADVLAESAVSIFGTCCGSIIVGGILGAVGGALWLVIQNRRSPGVA